MASFDLSPSTQALKTLGSQIQFMGCLYTIDKLLVIRCPSLQSAIVADALGLLKQSNCVDGCTGLVDFNPSITYQGIDRSISYEDTALVKTDEFSYGGYDRAKQELVLRYIDMLVV